MRARGGDDGGWADDAIASLLGACHPKQRDAVEDPSRWVACDVPRGGSKTTTALVKALLTMSSVTDAMVPYVATTKGHAVDIVWRRIKRTLGGVRLEARLSESEKTVTLVKNGSVLKLCGADDDAEVDKLRGFPVHGLVIDEAAYHSPRRLAYLLEDVIGPRHLGWTMLISSPGRKLSGLFYEATRPGGELHRPYVDRHRDEEPWPGWSSHKWTLQELQEWARAEGLTESELYNVWDRALRNKRANKWGDDNPKWKREYLGIWAADDTDAIYKYRPVLTGEDAIKAGVENGADWNRWDPLRTDGALKVADLARDPLTKDRNDWCWALAYDKGSGRALSDKRATERGPSEEKESRQDAFAVNAFAFSPSDPEKRILHVYGDEFVGFYARRFAELLVGNVDEWLRSGKPGAGSLYSLLGFPVGAVGDTDATFIQELLTVYGLKTTEAKRARELKHGAIELLNGDLVDGRLKVLKGSKLEEQFIALQWEEDAVGQLRENKAQKNNSADCAAYGRRLIAHLFESGQVVGAPAEKPAPRLPGERAAPPVEPAVTYSTEWVDAPGWMEALAPEPYEDTPWP